MLEVVPECNNLVVGPQNGDCLEVGYSVGWRIVSEAPKAIDEGIYV